jgi:F-type H+-transporting ATPase subunit a
VISPLASTPLFHIGPAPVTEAVVATWAIMAVLVGGSAVITRRLSLNPSKVQAVCELDVDTVDGQIRDTKQ